ncbi:Opacity protein antigens [Legionella massiliensis]|uniref:Opacity protein antigens n=1 Tax=Legionella massiliensis TaxID=1034943 RepID=A0A078KWY7_9GAMM|nr:porin family protein [Legionella massiliensis]CDZ77542.1 Opacity protein antigens [Legionella massiliensis]CEE13280.1 hypothetical protein BN1094_01825 [Legionella massiliensis]
MRYQSILTASAIFLASSSTFAGTMGSVEQPSWTWFGTFSAGPVWENGGKTQTFYLTPSIEKTYKSNKSNKALFDGEIFVGLQKALSQTFQGQLGLAVAATNSAKLSGHIWDDADPLFDNYIYNYKIQHTHIAVKGKVLADAGFWVMPWLSASVGVGFNNAHGFNNTPTIFEAEQTPNFASHTKTTYSYTLGAGVQKALNSHWQVGAGYEFADWGKSNLGRAPAQSQGSGLKLNHFYTNGVLFNITYVA